MDQESRAKNVWSVIVFWVTYKKICQIIAFKWTQRTPKYVKEVEVGKWAGLTAISAISSLAKDVLNTGQKPEWCGYLKCDPPF